VKRKLVDTNVIIRFLVEDPGKVHRKFRGVFTFFPRVERGEVRVLLLDLVVFEAFFVLKSVYDVPEKTAAQKLGEIVAFRGMEMQDKPTMLRCLSLLETEKIDLVDAYLLASAEALSFKEVFSFDKDLAKRGLACVNPE
jgi:predicted nucleic-acid-binding protein